MTTMLTDLMNNVLHTLHDGLLPSSSELSVWPVIVATVLMALMILRRQSDD